MWLTGGENPRLTGLRMSERLVLLYTTVRCWQVNIVYSDLYADPPHPHPSPTTTTATDRRSINDRTGEGGGFSSHARIKIMEKGSTNQFLLVLCL